ncbi:MAG: hypothetical protein GY943_05425 [Chloroflexi bacterium]|nr:hypothetical protein [Chloroflexota bacterium]
MNRRQNAHQLLLPQQRPSLEKGRNEAALGRLHRAAHFFNQAISIGDAGVDAAHLALSDLYYEWNDLSNAASHIEQGSTISKLQNNIPMQIVSLRLWARLQLANQNIETANDAMRQVHDLTEEHQMPAQIQDQNIEWEIMLALNKQDINGAKHWLSKLRMPRDVFYPTQSISYARVLLATDRRQKAQNLLAQWITTAVKNQLHTATITLLSLQALTSYESSLTFLSDALTLARKEKFVRTFIDLGSEMKQLLHRVRSVNGMGAYAETLLLAFNQTTHTIPAMASPPINAVQPTSTQLSTKDLEMMRLIMDGKSYQEIATLLSLSYQDVKAQMDIINNKLGI